MPHQRFLGGGTLNYSNFVDINIALNQIQGKVWNKCVLLGTRINSYNRSSYSSCLRLSFCNILNSGVNIEPTSDISTMTSLTHLDAPSPVWGDQIYPGCIHQTRMIPVADCNKSWRAKTERKESYKRTILQFTAQLLRRNGKLREIQLCCLHATWCLARHGEVIYISF